MKKLIQLIILIISMSGVYCASGRVTGLEVKNDLINVAAFIKDNKDSLNSLDRKTVGERGYFYVIRNDGVVLFHPQKKLINMNFVQYPFVREILRRRNGCLSYRIEGIQRYIFFNGIDDDRILCVAIESSEFSEPVSGCASE